MWKPSWFSEHPSQSSGSNTSWHFLLSGQLILWTQANQSLLASKQIFPKHLLEKPQRANQTNSCMLCPHLQGVTSLQVISHPCWKERLCGPHWTQASFFKISCFNLKALGGSFGRQIWSWDCCLLFQSQRDSKYRQPGARFGLEMQTLTIAAKKSKDIPAAVVESTELHRVPTWCLHLWVLACLSVYRSGMCFFPAECCQVTWWHSEITLHYIWLALVSCCHRGKASVVKDLQMALWNWGLPPGAEEGLSPEPQSARRRRGLETAQ